MLTAQTQKSAGQKNQDEEFTLPWGREIYQFITTPQIELSVAALVLVGCLLQALETVNVNVVYYRLEDVRSPPHPLPSCCPLPSWHPTDDYAH